MAGVDAAALSGERFRCARCGMRFRVEAPRTEATEASSCAEPGCGRLFWHAQQAQGAPVIVGVWPEPDGGGDGP